jgi:hypothetical protein
LLASTDMTALAGHAFTGEVATFATAPAMRVSALISWGDGHTSRGTIIGSKDGEAVVGTHTYGAPGYYVVTVSLLPGGFTQPLVQSVVEVLSRMPPPQTQAGGQSQAADQGQSQSPVQATPATTVVDSMPPPPTYTSQGSQAASSGQVNYSPPPVPAATAADPPPVAPWTDPELSTAATTAPPPRVVGLVGPEPFATSDSSASMFFQSRQPSPSSSDSTPYVSVQDNGLNRLTGAPAADGTHLAPPIQTSGSDASAATNLRDPRGSTSTQVQQATLVPLAGGQGPSGFSPLSFSGNTARGDVAQDAAGDPALAFTPAGVARLADHDFAAGSWSFGDQGGRDSRASEVTSPLASAGQDAVQPLGPAGSHRQGYTMPLYRVADRADLHGLDTDAAGRPVGDPLRNPGLVEPSLLQNARLDGLDEEGHRLYTDLAFALSERSPSGGRGPGAGDLPDSAHAVFQVAAAWVLVHALHDSGPRQISRCLSRWMERPRRPQ